MDFAIIALAALVASGLTLFSGFGLGTLLMPVMAIFLPVEVAIAVTAIVHLANNLFKLFLLGGRADRGVLLRFGVTAVPLAFVGAWLLRAFGEMEPLFRYTAFGGERLVYPVNLLIGLLILGFVILEQVPALTRMSVDRRYLPLGGAISGFFGGLSGHQGAFRSLFLIKAGLDKHAFVATGVVLAVMVDLARMAVYGWSATTTRTDIPWALAGTATLAAFAGAFFGALLLKKITILTVQRTVAALLVVVALALCSGLI